MAMLQSVVNGCVFLPPRDRNSLRWVQLLQHRRHMNFIDKPNGETISYLHFDAQGDLVTPGSLRSVTQSSMVILYQHGNAEDLGGSFGYAQSMATAFGVAVVVYDYCGYGFSGYPDATTPREVTEKSVYNDADHMFDHLLSMGYPAYRIILVGRSVGGGPACYLASKHHGEIAGLALISTFTSCLRVVSSCFLPLFCSCLDLFPNHRRIKDVTDCPVLVMHGTHDEVVPYNCSCELLDDLKRTRIRALKKWLKKHDKILSRQARDSRESPAMATVEERQGVSASQQAHEEVPHSTHSPLGRNVTSAFDLYHRAYAALPEVTKRAAEQYLTVTDADVRIGVFHRWFTGCGHNNIEEREGQDFSRSFLWFVRFAVAFSKERETAADANSGYHAAGTVSAVQPSSTANVAPMNRPATF